MTGPCTQTPSLPSGLCMSRGVCPLCLIFIAVLLCVPASKDCLCLFIHIGLLSCLICVAEHFFRTAILVDDLDFSAPVLMLLGFFWWSCAFRRSSAVMGHQILARWLCVCFSTVFTGGGTGCTTNRILLRRRKQIFYCILQSKRLKDEQILDKYSRESVSQKGLGLNPKRMILKILSSFTRFECRMLWFDARIFRRKKILFVVYIM